MLFSHLGRWLCEVSHSLHRIGEEVVCSVNTVSLGWGKLTLKASLARVLFFLDPATPMRASTSALRSFRMPTQSTLETDSMH